MINTVPEYLLLTFDNTHMVLKAEKLLLDQDLKPEIIPTPKDLSSDCGMAIRFRIEAVVLGGLVKLLNGANIAFRMHER